MLSTVCFSVKARGWQRASICGNGGIDDELFLSTGLKGSGKNIHAQNTPSEKAAAKRLALNLNVDLDRIPMQRGDWLLASRTT